MKAGLLVRISSDREDERVGVHRQETDTRALARRYDHDVVEVYVENDTSAYKRRTVTLPDGTRALRVVRPEYRRALDDLHSGRIEILIGYDLDRIVRDPRDLEDLIDVCEQTGRTAISVTGSLQLENSVGITMARVGVAMANQSSRDTARRVSRAREAAAAEGRWSGGGRRAYGYSSDRTAVVTAEAEIIAGIAADVLAGASLNAVATRLNDAGTPSASGKAWAGAHVRSVVTKPAVAGLLVYRGEVVGSAPWPAILDRDTWQQVCDELSNRTPRGDNTLRHWLSGVLVCSQCHLPLRGNGDRYWCGNGWADGRRGCGKISITADLTERYLEKLILRRVARTKVKPGKAVTSIAPDDAQLTELAEMWASREITLAEYRAARTKLLESVATPPTPTLPSWVGPNLADEWPDLPPASRRRLAAALLEGVIVHPSTNRRWSTERLEPHWR
ncbi:MAG: recombinase family protein [Nonomuraea sp.]|nr:recombinase family protein [Nonomuraea sp.]NUQ33269.1 recombinase family protein [Dermatophilaceae bacterium]NUR81087.1 recombinase family protein [Dermatophilaceae bacterium]